MVGWPKLVTALTLGLSTLLLARLAAGDPTPPPPPPLSASAAAAAPASPAPARAEVRFESDTPGLTLYRQRGVVPVVTLAGWPHAWWLEGGVAPALSPVCTAPCTTSLPLGVHHLALGEGAKPPVEPYAPVVISGPSTIRGHYDDKSATRAAGAAVGVGGSLLGAVMALGAVHSHAVCDVYGDCWSQSYVDAPLMTAGVGVLVGSIIVGAVLGSQRDEAHLTVEPLRIAPMVPERGARAASEPAPQGAAVSVHF